MTTTLGELVRRAGRDILSPTDPEPNLAAVVTGVHLHHPCERGASGGGLILAMDVDITTDAARNAVRDAVRFKASGIVFRTDRRMANDLAATAANGGVATFCLRADVDWGFLITMFMNETFTPSISSHEFDTQDNLFTVANAIASLLDAPVLIDDDELRVLAYSNLEPVDELRKESILGRRPPDAWLRHLQEDGTLDNLWNTDEIVHVESQGITPRGNRRLAIAIRDGQRVLGALWVAEGRVPLTEDTEVKLRAIAKVVAIHLLAYRDPAHGKWREIDELLRGVLLQETPTSQAWGQLGLDPRGHFALLAVQVISADLESELLTRRLRNTLALHVDSYRMRARYAVLGNVLYVLMELPADMDNRRLETFVSDMVQRASKATQVHIKAAVGDIFSDLTKIGDSRRQIEAALHLIAEARKTTVSSVDALRSRLVLLKLRQLATEMPELTEGRVRSLVQHDAARRTSYLSTLRAIFDCSGNISRAAMNLSIHENTLRYRIQRIQALSGLDLDDGVESLVANLQVHMLDSVPEE